MEIAKSTFIFQVDSDIIKEAFQKNNFLITYNEQCKEREKCAIYFSSNNIYFPNTEEEFQKKILDKDFYEMYNTRVDIAYKHIFVRDIQKQWYIGGINNRIDSPELLLQFLQKETKGYSVITIGSSAGGYAAVLYGSLLSAKRVFSFNGQFEIQSLLKTSNHQTNPLLFRNADSNLFCYFDLRNFIKKDIVIYYFSSLGSEWDYQQYKHIIDISSVKTILFKTSHHGVPFVKSALPIVINMESEVLDKFVGQKLNTLWFSVQMIGFKKIIWTLYKQVKLKKILRNIKTLHKVTDNYYI